MIDQWIRNALGQREIRQVAEMSDLQALDASALEARIQALENRLYFTIWAEDNGTLVTGRMDLSLGNGNEQGNVNNAGAWGVVMPFPWVAVAGSFGSRTATDGNGASIRLTRNIGGNQATPSPIIGSDIAIPAGQRSGHLTFPSTISGGAGDALNFVTVNPGGNDLVGAIVGYFTI